MEALKKLGKEITSVDFLLFVVKVAVAMFAFNWLANAIEPRARMAVAGGTTAPFKKQPGME